MSDEFKGRFNNSWVSRVNSDSNKEVDDGKRFVRINKLEAILVKAASGAATTEDLAKARELNNLLGGEFSSLIAEVERMIEWAEELKHTNSASIEHSVEIVTSADSYFNREEVKVARQAIEDVESGKNISDSIFTKMMKYLISDDEVKLRGDALYKLELEKIAIIDAAILRNDKEISNKDKSRLEKIDNKIISLIQDEKKGEVVKVIFTTTLLSDLIASRYEKNNPKINEISIKRQKAKEALVEHKKQSVESAKKQTDLATEELKDLMQAVTQNHTEDKPGKTTEAQNLASKQAAIEKAHALIKGVTKEQRKAAGLNTTKGEEKAKEKKKEEDKKISSVDVKTDDEKGSKEGSIAAKLAAKKAKKTSLPQSVKRCSALEASKELIKSPSTPVVIKKVAPSRSIN